MMGGSMRLIRRIVNMAVMMTVKLMFIAMGVVICMPVFLVVTGSVMGSADLQECLAPVFLEGQGFVTWKLIPQYPTLEHYKRLLIETPQFFILFWNSINCLLYTSDAADD